MKILAITDLHGRSVDKLLGIEDVNLVVVLGDITTGGTVKATRDRIEPLIADYENLVAIPGNWERDESIRWLSDIGANIDGTTREIGDVVFFGSGASLPTPIFTPNVISEEEMERRLSACPLPGAGKKLIVCSHNPPHGALDRISTSLRVGSRSLTDLIHDIKPSLVLTGHIHEQRGSKMLGNTRVVNPGPAPGHYALIDTGEEISVELY